jgi:hypothetical protein
MPASSAAAGEHDPVGGDAGLQRAMHLAHRHHVGAGAEPAERADDRLVGVRLQRIVDADAEGAERLHIGLVVVGQRGAGIAIERRADRVGNAPHRNLLDMQLAADIGEVGHRGLSY